MVRLPVSGLEPALRQPDGADELALREAVGSVVSRALALLSRLSDQTNWSALTVTDFEVLLLNLRGQVLGEACDLGFACPHCAERVEVSFHLTDYLRGITPRRPAAVADVPGRPGWFACDGVQFRLPTAGDQAAVAGVPDAARRLGDRCIDAAKPPARLRGRIERMMAAMAPEVSRPLSGQCPSCGAQVAAPLHVTRLVVGELSREAGSLHDEVDLIASAYHWPEAEILRLPRCRRQAYAERIRQAA